MKPTRIALAVLAALAVLVAAGCGDDEQKVPTNAVAVVDWTPVTKAELDSLLARAKATYKSQKRAFPKAGTAEYQQLQTQAVAFLVQRAEYDNKAEDLDLKVTEKEIDERLTQIKTQSFGGSQSKLDAQVKAQGYTKESLRDDVRAQLLSEKIYDAVTKDAKVTDAAIAKYYNENKSKYVTAESRDVRHILVKTKAQATDLYNQIKAGGNFAALAKKYSTDTTSAVNGGKLTIVRGQTVQPFDTTAFMLPVNAVSRPVKTEYGYHVIQPVSAIKPSTTTSLKDATESIRAQLLDTEKTALITKWTADTKDFFAKKVAYATGFAPPAAATEPGTTEPATTTNS